MKIVTFNAGLLSMSLLGGLKKVEPAGWVQERLSRMPPGLLEIRPDILLLQEVYSLEHKRWLARELSHWLPHAAFGVAAPWYRLLPDSLMILSRYPIDQSGFVRFRAGRWDERLLDTKGFFFAKMGNTPVGPLLITNMHTTAGLFTHPEHPKIDRVREAQIDQAIDHLERYAHGVRVVLAGDLNCGPGVVCHGEPEIPPLVLKDAHVPASERVSLSNYLHVARRGFSDTHQTLGLSNRATWSPTSNPLNRGGDHASWGCPAQRIDHVFVRPSELRPTAAGLFGEEAVVEISGPGPTALPLSDHYGYWVDVVTA